MTTTGCKLRQRQCVANDLSELPADGTEPVRSDNDAIEPVHLPSSANATDEPHVRTVDLGHNVGDEIFRQAKGIRNLESDFIPTHIATPKTPRWKHIQRRGVGLVQVNTAHFSPVKVPASSTLRIKAEAA